jgi:hypothetical protein
MPRKTVRINTEPAGAKVTVLNKAGAVVCTTNTPATVKLARNIGWFRPAQYEVQLEKTGYHAETVNIRPGLNYFYWGNIAIGGAIGMAVVDPLTGAMWRLSPRKIDLNLVAETASSTDATAIRAAKVESNDPKK